MFSFKVRLLALVLAPLVVVGCGKQPASSVSVGGQTERVVSNQPHFKTSTGATKAPVGVLVDGRWYAKGNEPVAVTTPAPATPATGKGHLHVVLSLKGITDFTDKVRIRLKNSGAKADVTTFDFAHELLVGNSAQTTLLNLTPGDYTLLVDTLNGAGGLVSESSSTVTVISAKTEEAIL
jgi:hypothetical protein